MSPIPPADDTPATPPKPLDVAFDYVDAANPPQARTGRTLRVGPAADIPEGGRQIVTEGRLSVGVFRVNGQLYAIRNYCPHQGAPLCEGKLHTTHRPAGAREFQPDLENRVLRCPWHGWEFDLFTGKGLYDAHSRVATYETRVDEAGDVHVVL